MAGFRDGPDEDTRARGALSWRRFARSLTYALQGLSSAWRTQANFRIELMIALLVILLSLYLGTGTLSVLVMCAVVLPLELLNSALEATLDLVSPDKHPLVKQAKDLAAAAVLIAAVISLIIGLWLLGPPLLAKLGL